MFPGAAPVAAIPVASAPTKFVSPTVIFGFPPTLIGVDGIGVLLGIDGTPSLLGVEGVPGLAGVTNDTNLIGGS